MHNTPKVTINTISDTEIEIEGELTAEQFASYKSDSLKYLSSSVKLDGFRTGHIPENVLRDKLGPMVILEEMAERALRDVYPGIVIDNKIEAIDRPNISITKIAEGSPLGFKIKQTILPPIDLPDYKKIAEKINKKIDKESDGKENLVSDEELNKVVEEIMKQREGKDLSPEEKENVKKNLVHEKELRARDKRRLAIIDAILAEMKITVPKVLIEKQMDRFMSEMRTNIENMRLKWEDYLAHIKKPESEIRESGREDAEKRVKTELLLGELAKAEKIEADKTEADKEVAHILEHHKGAEEDNVRDYVENILRNTKVFEMLENIK